MQAIRIRLAKEIPDANIQLRDLSETGRLMQMLRAVAHRHRFPPRAARPAAADAAHRRRFPPGAARINVAASWRPRHCPDPGWSSGSSRRP